MSPADFFLLCLCPKIAPSREPAFPAKRSKWPVEVEIDWLSSMPAKELSHWKQFGLVTLVCVMDEEENNTCCEQKSTEN